jgi:hypothetical protein
MVPRSILQQLGRLRRLQRLVQLAWGAARWLAVMIPLLMLACAVDWLIDRRQETPWGLRWAMLLVQLTVALSMGLVLVVVPLSRRASTSRLALWVEEQTPRLGHRLISAVQLNQAGARTEGMSAELIAAVTAEAEAQAGTIDFAGLVSRRPLTWSVWAVAPLLLASALLLALWPATVLVLLARQFLADEDIPRAVSLESLRAEAVWPAGEEGSLRFRVVGEDLPEDLQGEVRVDPDGQPREHYALVLEGRDEAGQAIYQARIPASSTDFTYVAWLNHSRTRRPARVRFEPRPAVTKQEAWVLLPSYCGLRSNWRLQAALDSVPVSMGLAHVPVALLATGPFEEPQKGGDIVRRLPGSAARVAVDIQKPVVTAKLEILGAKGPAGEGVRRQLDLMLHKGGQRADGIFLPEPGDTSYRIIVTDGYGFTNGEAPRRHIRSVPLDPPQVALLPELFRQPGDAGSAEDYEVEGMPVPQGRKIRIGYQATAPYGLGRARLRYRVLPANRAGEDPAGENEIPWRPHPLKEVAADADRGPFDPQRGLFHLSGEDDQVEFHAVPAQELDKTGRTEGGGRFDFQTKGIPDGTGGLLDLAVGDRIEYYVEVFDRVPDPDRPPGRSEVRVKTVVTVADWLAWKKEKERQEERLAQLETKQRGVFGGTVVPVDDPLPVVSPAGAVRDQFGRRPVIKPAPAPAQQGFGRNWLLLGPFPNPDDKGHALVFPPETDSVHLGKEYAGLKGKVGWVPHHSATDKIDLEKFFEHGEAGVAYALCWLRCDRRKALLATGSDDGIKVWINRRLVLDQPVHREAVAGDDKTPVELSGSWNELLVKVDNKFGSWAFFLELRDLIAGRPNPVVECRLTPPPEDERKYVRTWQVLGPFPNANGSGHDTVLPPEKDPVDLSKEYDGIKGKIRWKAHYSEKGKIDLEKLHGPAAGVAYAVCWVRCEQHRNAVLATGSHDGLKVWINRKPAIDKKESREAVPGEDTAKIALEAGWNEVLVKVDNQAGHWAFYLELRDPSNIGPPEGLEFRLTVPAERNKK